MHSFRFPYVPLIFGVRPVIRCPLGAPLSRRHLGSDPLPSSDSIKKKKLNFSSCGSDQTERLMHFLCDVFFPPSPSFPQCTTYLHID